MWDVHEVRSPSLRTQARERLLMLQGGAAFGVKRRWPGWPILRPDADLSSICGERPFGAGGPVGLL